MNRNRLFSDFSIPHPLHLAAFAFIAIVLVFLVVVPAEILYGILRLPIPSQPGIPVDRTSAGMLWLLFANLVSFIAVMVLLLDLWRLAKQTQGQQFELNVSLATSRCRLNPANQQRAAVNPITWATRPLNYTYAISAIVLIGMVSSFVVTVFVVPKMTHALFVGLTIFTGLGYLSAMSIGDLFAQTAYHRCSCLKHVWAVTTTQEQRAVLEQEYDRFVEALSDYERIVRFVDAPIVISLLMITGYKIFTLGSVDGYHFGFVAGSVAMHVIFANIISLIIVACPTRVEVDVV